MRIAICGAGLVGSYLYRLLNRAGFGQVTVYESPQPHRTHCGISSCAWATPPSFPQFITDAGLSPEKYVLQDFNRAFINDMTVTASILVIDKPKLITDLLAGIEVKTDPVNPGDYDRIIDATGVARAYLPRIDDDIIASSIQYRVYSAEPLMCGINISNLGYVWRFPLSNNEYHVGAGSIKVEPQQMLDRLGWLNSHKRICSCESRIRFTAPHYSLPFTQAVRDGTNYSIWGVGEAIGCVAPLAGEGIVPGLKSARLLMSNWESPDDYQRSILNEFMWMEDERRIIDKLLRGEGINLLDARVLKNNVKRLGLKIGSWQAVKILKNLARFD